MIDSRLLAQIPIHRLYIAAAGVNLWTIKQITPPLYSSDTKKKKKGQLSVELLSVWLTSLGFHSYNSCSHSTVLRAFFFVHSSFPSECIVPCSGISLSWSCSSRFRAKCSLPFMFQGKYCPFRNLGTDNKVVTLSLCIGTLFLWILFVVLIIIFIIWFIWLPWYDVSSSRKRVICLLNCFDSLVNWLLNSFSFLSLFRHKLAYSSFQKFFWQFFLAWFLPVWQVIIPEWV